MLTFPSSSVSLLRDAVSAVRLASLILGLGLGLQGAKCYADPVTARFPQGFAHEYVTLKTLDGKLVATGEGIQTVKGSRVTSRLVFYFRDGSVDDDLTVYTQDRVFHLVSDHHIQRGPFFPKPIDFLINGLTGQVTVRTPNGKVTEKHFDLPEDVSNGLPPNILLSILPSAAETKISYMLPSENPRLVHLVIKVANVVPFAVGSLRRKATDYSIHVELGGVAGVVAPIIGREPPDYHVWVQDGVPPAFIREEGPLYEGGPILRIEPATARFPR